MKKNKTGKRVQLKNDATERDKKGKRSRQCSIKFERQLHRLLVATIKNALKARK